MPRSALQGLNRIPARTLAAVRFVLSDLDDTITHEGRLPAAAFARMEAFTASGRNLVIVTGRPAGWCDMIARFWPVAGVVGENGAFYFRYRHDERRMVRKFVRTAAERARDGKALRRMLARVQKKYPDIGLADDQPFRISDIAIDVCEDRPPLPDTQVRDIIERLGAMGATVKLSSIHINAWIGDFDKLSMMQRLLADEFGVSDRAALRSCAYIGDSPNDEPMFRHFPLSVGVANIQAFADRMEILPAYVASKPGGHGFVQFIDRLTVPSISNGR